MRLREAVPAMVACCARRESMSQWYVGKRLPVRNQLCQTFDEGRVQVRSLFAGVARPPHVGLDTINEYIHTLKLRGCKFGALLECTRKASFPYRP